MSEPSLRDQIAETAARWFFMYPIPAWSLAEGTRAERLARSWGDGIVDAVLPVVQGALAAKDHEIEQLAGQLADTQCELADARLQAESAEVARQAEVKAAERWRNEAEQAEAERDRLRAQTEQQWQLTSALTTKLEMVRELVTMPHNAKNRLSSRVLSVLDLPDPAALDQTETT